MLPRPLVVAAALIALAAALPAPGADPDRLRIPQVETALQGRDVAVTAGLSRPLPEDVRKRLASGLPTTVTWQVRLFVSRRKWWDDPLDERRYAVTATYRPVGGDFAVERRLDGRLLETVVLPSLAEAEAALSALAGLPCFRMGPALAGPTLAGRVRCVYGSRLALGFLPTAVGTSWRKSPVFRWREPGGTP